MASSCTSTEDYRSPNVRLHLHLFAGLDWLLLDKTPTCPTTRTRLDSWTYLDSPDQLWNGKRGKSPTFVALLVFSIIWSNCTGRGHQNLQTGRLFRGCCHQKAAFP